MAVKSVHVVPQAYPRHHEGHECASMLDESALASHPVSAISAEKLKQLLESCIIRASRKSGREILNLPDGISAEETERRLLRKGKDLFNYFRKYPGDPAATAHQIHRKHFRDVAIEQFHNQSLQKGRMNSGWRYQFLAFDCANASHRFKSVADIGAKEADFVAVIDRMDVPETVSLYVSVKNRTNTMGGQDWPKAIAALEQVAKHDKNRSGAYCCVFGIAMDRGSRRIRRKQDTKLAYSPNTEEWLSDFFWTFFANRTYTDIMSAMLDVLDAQQQKSPLVKDINIPEKLLEGFGVCCKDHKLIDDSGRFNDAHAMVRFFCEK